MIYKTRICFFFVCFGLNITNIKSKKHNNFIDHDQVMKRQSSGVSTSVIGKGTMNSFGSRDL